MATLLKLAEDYLAANAALCEGLVAEVRAAGGDETALDELLHEDAENDGRDADEASAVNNAGLDFQVACLLEGNGVEEGSRLVRAAIPAVPSPR